ncbi:glycerol-3-phosphate responsive antiterminator [Psychrilyobacter atlanticus]|uniref:glycerol-3-phosphate responsive antiterminator n=1 Tax=Psychrilyobacter atlanticus TaxID=271091 RepID=UPI0003FF9E69|nr:glycerol-3-phosphate responsive antiterminator [Psychrilyobacter atlanticus]
MGLIEKLELNPIIAAVKDEKTLREALNSDIEVIFLLKSTILTIETMVEKIKKTGKIVFVHIDLIDGMSPTVDALEYLNEKTELDGIISTKSALIKEAKKRKLLTIQRFFILDSISYKNSLKYARATKPDIVEILPGAMPKIIKRFLYNYKCPLIASGIIMDKEDVILALKAGAIGISTTKSDIWTL